MPQHPKPTALRVLEGNPSHRPLPPNEPKPLVLTEFSAPEWLTETGQRAYLAIAPELAKAGLLTRIDVMALGMLCDAMADYLDAAAVLKAEGRTYEHENTRGSIVLKDRPEVRQKAEAWGRVLELMLRFGMTPGDRTRIQVSLDTDDDDPFEQFDGYRAQ